MTYSNDQIREVQGVMEKVEAFQSDTTERQSVVGPMVNRLNPGAVGGARLQRFTVTPDDAKLAELRWALNRHREVLPPSPGQYLRLTVDGVLMMSDTRNEVATNQPAISKLLGQALVFGLGMGYVICESLERGADFITVVELSSDVIELVGPQIHALYPGRVKIIHGDARTWKPSHANSRYDSCWVDIWPDICTDNLEELHAIRRKLCYFMKRPGSIHGWMEESLKQSRGSGW